MNWTMKETQFQNEIKTNYIKYCSVNSEPIEIRAREWKFENRVNLLP